MKAIHPIKTGLAFAAIVALVHAFWVLMVAAGVAQRWTDFIFWMHFVQPVWIILPFDLGTAFMLVGMAAICSFIIGIVFAFVWNWLHLD